MTKSILIDKVTEKVDGLTRRQTEIIVETFFDSIKGALSNGEKIELRGFGNFKLKTRGPRKARNPKTGESVDVPVKKVLHFKPGKELREMLNSSTAS
ncbi:MAG: integration host factor subunit beta [Nitrospirota bacterium]|nr:MAG: integration host factor subunit beta [Nitrospirota bacterium]